jgi:hypothetical protein
MWRHVDLAWTDVSEERIVSNFRIQKSSSEKPVAATCSRWFLPHGLFYPDTFLRNVGSHKIYTALHPRRQHWSRYRLYSCLYRVVHISSINKLHKGWSRRIWGSHSSDYEQSYLLGHKALLSVESKPTFRRNISPPSSCSKNKPRQKQAYKQLTIGAVTLKRRLTFKGLHDVIS